jgi:hypothetical protein
LMMMMMMMMNMMMMMMMAAGFGRTLALHHRSMIRFIPDLLGGSVAQVFRKEVTMRPSSTWPSVSCTLVLRYS